MIKVIINGDNYKRCVDFANDMWANKKKGLYGSGVGNSKGDPTRVERIGALGEMAIHMETGLPLDFRYVKGGKPYDFILEDGTTIDAKTTQTKDRSYIFYKYPQSTDKERVFNTKSKPVCDLYIVCQVLKDSLNDNEGIVLIRGYQDKDYVLELPIRRSRVSGQMHFNLELDFKTLRGMGEILQRLKGG